MTSALLAVALAVMQKCQHVFDNFVLNFKLNQFSHTGDIVGLGLSKGDSQQDNLASGVITRVGISFISVAFDESLESLDLDDSVAYKLIKLANDVTYKRLKQALSKLNNFRSGPPGQLINVLFDVSKPSPPISFERDGLNISPDIEFFNPGLDESQREAVRFALFQRELAIIHGPPGTGKTTTVVEIILQAIKRKIKILACAPSNIAVDNLVERVVSYDKKVVRIGHPARLLPSIQKYALDAILANSEETKLVEDVRKDMDKALFKMKKTRHHGEKQQYKDDMKHLRKELRERERTATKGILSRAEVVMATLTGASSDGPLKLLGEEHFDLIIIDECSQALEAACWIALLKGRRCILAGDHHQLPPTILSHEAAKEGLALTLMERQLKLHGDSVMRMLTMQYRMNEVIMKWASDQLYGGLLTAHESVAKHLLRDVERVEDNEDTSIPMLLIDTAGCNLNELHLPEEVSKGNEGEADIVCFHVERLIKSGLHAEDIAVIAPYNLQVDILRLQLSPKHPLLEIKSVDGFQGREKEAVIISMVRSNDSGEVGFLAENRRINVAITRARRHLVVVCDTDTVSHHPFLKQLTDYMMENGEVRSAQQYLDDGAINTEYVRPEYVEKQFKASEEWKTQKKMTQNVVRNKPVKPNVRTNTTKDNNQNKQKYPEQGNVHSIVLETENIDDERVYLQTQIENFVQDDKAMKYAFPPTLSSKGRFLVHELAEAFGLLHISEGDGNERHITVKKTEDRTPSQNSTSSIVESNETPSLGIVVKQKLKKIPDVCVDVDKSSSVKLENNTVCDKCGKLIPKGNLDLHLLRCGSGNKGVNDVSVKPKKKKSAKSKPSKLKEEEEDFDSLIQAAMEENNVCNYSKCKAYTTTIGQICSFCKKRFCLSHHIPEVHGCGSQAKAHARAVINSEGILYRGSGVPDKKIDPNKRAYLQRKLDKKMNEMTDQRKVKKKENN